MTDHLHKTRARIYRLHVDEKLSYQAIADMEGMTRSAVGSIIRKWPAKVREAELTVGAMGWSIRK